MTASCDKARLWSSRIIAEKLPGFSPGAFFMAMYALVLAGLPTIRILDVAPGGFVQRPALGAEYDAVRFQQILALHTFAARARAHEHGDSRVAKSHFGIVSHGYVG